MPSKILMYSGTTTGTTTTGDQYAFFINETGLPTVKNGSQTITFGTNGYAFAGSSGSSGQSGSNGSSGTNGVSGTSGQNGAPGDIGTAGVSGTSGVSGTAGINGVDGGIGSAGTSGLSYGSSGSSGLSGTNGLTALGAASKGGSVPITGFTGDPLIYNVVFASNFANTNYSVIATYNGVEVVAVGGLDPWVINKTISGFTINTGLTGPVDPSIDTIDVDWLAVSQGETGVSGAPGSSGSAGSSGLSYGTSGTSGGVGATGSSGSSGQTGTSGSSGATGSSGSSGGTGASGSSGSSGSSGATGSSGSSGNSGAGVPTGGTAGQVLAKIDGTNFNTQWVNQSGGGGGTGITFNQFWSTMVDDLDPHPGDGGSLIPYTIRITADATYKTVVNIVDSANTVLKTVYTGSTAPNPPTIPMTSIVAWYKADAGITSSGGQITAWADQSGNDYHLEAPAGKEPNYSGTTLNGILIPDTIAGWTSSLDRRLRTTTTIPSIGETGTVFIVGAQYVGETFYNLFIDYNTTSGYQVCRDAGDDTILGGYGQDPAPYGSQVAATNGTFYTIRSLGNGTTSQLTLNGTITGTTFTDGSPSGTAYLNVFNSDANRPGKKAIAEIIIYSDALSAGDIADVELYLRNKWGHY